MKRLFRKLLLATASVGIGLVASLVVLEIVFRLLPTSDTLLTQPVNTENSVLRFAPNRDVLISRGRAFHLAVQKRVNNDGFVNDQDYDRRASTPLLAVVGDSYVEATQVAYGDTFFGVLAERVAGRGRVYSFGVSGAQLPTYFSHAEYAAKGYGAKVLVFVIVGNDFDESLYRYKWAPAFHYYRRGADGALELMRVDYAPSKVTTLARRSALVRYLVINLELNHLTLWNRIARDANAMDATAPRYVGNTLASADAERVAESKEAVDQFLAGVARGTGLSESRIVFVVDGIRPQLYEPEGLARVDDSYFAIMRQYFMARARARGYEVIDLQSEFISKHQATGERFEFEQDHHWNAAGHRVVAAAIAESAAFRALFDRP